MLNRNLKAKKLLTPGIYTVVIEDSSLGFNTKGKEYAMFKLRILDLDTVHNVFINEYEVTNKDGSKRTVTLDENLSSYNNYLGTQLDKAGIDAFDFVEANKIPFTAKFETEYLNFSIPATKIEGGKVTEESIDDAISTIGEIA